MEGLPGDLTLFPAGSDVTLLPQEADTAWKSAYRDYIQKDLLDTANNSGTGPLMEQAQYYLFDANGDATPELWIDYMFTYAGQRLCTYAGGRSLSSPSPQVPCPICLERNCLLAPGGGWMSITTCSTASRTAASSRPPGGTTPQTSKPATPAATLSLTTPGTAPPSPPPPTGTIWPPCLTRPGRKPLGNPGPLLPGNPGAAGPITPRFPQKSAQNPSLRLFTGWDSGIIGNIFGNPKERSLSMKKRLLSLALALCLVCSLLPGTALAAGENPFHRRARQPLGPRRHHLRL